MNYNVKTGVGMGNMLQVVLLGNDGLPYLAWQDTQGKWYYNGVLTRDSVNKSYEDLATGTGKNGNLQVFMLGHEDGLIHVTEQNRTTGNWIYKLPLPNPLNNLKFTAIATGIDYSGNLVLVCLGNDKQPYVVQQDQNGNYNFTGLLPNLYVTNFFVKLAMGVTDAGNLQVILIGNDGYPYVIQQDKQGKWGSLTRMDNPANIQYSSVVTGPSYNGKLNVYLIGKYDGQLYLIEQSNNSVAGSNKGVIPHYMNMLPLVGVSSGLGNDGTPQVICICNDGQPYLIYQDHSSGTWSYYGKLPSAPQKLPFKAVAVGIGNGKNLQVICLDVSTQPYLIWQDHNSGAWGYYGPVPYLSQVKIVDTAIQTGYANSQQVICLGSDGRLYSNWQDHVSGSWHKFNLLPFDASLPFFTSISMTPGNGGNLQLICLADDRKLYLVYQDNKSGGWSFYGALPNDPKKVRYFTSVASCVGGDGNLQVISLNDNGQPYLIWQDRNNGSWHFYGALPTDPDNFIKYSSVTPVIGADGNLQLILLGSGLPYLIQQTRNNGNWQYIGSLPTDPNNFRRHISVTAAIGGDGNLQVVLLGSKDGKPYLIWQDRKGSWNYYGLMPASNVQFTALEICLNNVTKELTLECVGQDGHMYRTWQDQKGNWFNSGVMSIGSSQLPLFMAVTSGICPHGGSMTIYIGKSDGQPYYGQTNPTTKKWAYNGLLESPQ
jgi:hypothetical protein